jgi:hypothetical protein
MTTCPSNDMFALKIWQRLFSGVKPKPIVFLLGHFDSRISHEVRAFYVPHQADRNTTRRVGCILWEPGTTKPETWVRRLERVLSAGDPCEIV